MPYAKLIVPTLLFATQVGAEIPDLHRLDCIGRQIAEIPCAKPKLATRTEKSIHDDSIQDKIITQSCPGVQSQIVRSSQSGYSRALPLSTSLTQVDKRMPIAFQVGASIKSIRNRLGEPETAGAESITYLLPSETRQETISFIHNGSQVTRVQWSWYFD